MHARKCAVGCLVLSLVGCGEAGADAANGGAGRTGTGATAATGSAASGASSGAGTNDSGSAGGSGSAGSSMMPATKANDCAALPEVGVFEEVTPPMVKAGIGMKHESNQTQGGPFAMAVDPVNQGTV